MFHLKNVIDYAHEFNDYETVLNDRVRTLKRITVFYKKTDF